MNALFVAQALLCLLLGVFKLILYVHLAGGLSYSNRADLAPLDVLEYQQQISCTSSPPPRFCESLGWKNLWNAKFYFLSVFTDHPADEASQQKEYAPKPSQKAVCAVKWMWCVGGGKRTEGESKVSRLK